MDKIETQEMEDKLARLADALSRAEQAILYRYLYNLGHRISTVEATIRQELRKERVL